MTNTSLFECYYFLNIHEYILKDKLGVYKYIKKIYKPRFIYLFLTFISNRWCMSYIKHPWDWETNQS
jgi:hypothetical protein